MAGLRTAESEIRFQALLLNFSRSLHITPNSRCSWAIKSRWTMIIVAIQLSSQHFARPPRCRLRSELLESSFARHITFNRARHYLVNPGPRHVFGAELLRTEQSTFFCSIISFQDYVVRSSIINPSRPNLNIFTLISTTHRCR